jgi:hypothetical protein
MQQIKGKDMTYKEFDEAMGILLTPEPDDPIPDEKPKPHPEHREDPKQYPPEELEPKPTISTFKAQPWKGKDHAPETKPDYPKPPKVGRPPAKSKRY